MVAGARLEILCDIWNISDIGSREAGGRIRGERAGGERAIMIVTARPHPIQSPDGPGAHTLEQCEDEAEVAIASAKNEELSMRPLCEWFFLVNS